MAKSKKKYTFYVHNNQCTHNERLIVTPGEYEKSPAGHTHYKEGRIEQFKNGKLEVYAEDTELLEYMKIGIGKRWDLFEEEEKEVTQVITERKRVQL